jgi:thioredoxin reductase (NADPH)
MIEVKTWEAIIVGGGVAGLSAAIYLGRAQRDTLVIDSGKSMAKWEPEVQNYLGFPKGIAGKELLRRGEQQAKRYGVHLVSDEVLDAGKRNEVFDLRGRKRSYRAKFLLLATGIFHIPPAINGVRACLGHSMFFCKDCDGIRVQGKQIAIYGANNEAVEYALGMLLYSSCVAIVTNGCAPQWDKTHAGWIREYQIPVYPRCIEKALCQGCQIQCLKFADGSDLPVQALFTTRGDIYHNKLAKMLGTKIVGGEIVVDHCQRTSVKGLYGAGCVTPANCQMVIAAGQGATAAQSINRDLFKQTLAAHSLPRCKADNYAILVRSEPELKVS